MTSNEPLETNVTSYIIKVRDCKAAWSRLKFDFKEFLLCFFGENSGGSIMEEVGNLKPGTLYLMSRNNEHVLKTIIATITEYKNEDCVLHFDASNVYAQDKLSCVVELSNKPESINVTLSRIKKKHVKRCFPFMTWHLKRSSFFYLMREKAKTKEIYSQDIEFALKRFFHVTSRTMPSENSSLLVQ
eukprot:snap_masked-scaffold_5-processed-gene-20.41-mRNA-1 protein AED:1.00 eAED:1.00 QI:0/-1/0/0/-1/1/1/0/185